MMASNGKSIQQARSEMIQQIEAELPNDLNSLKQFTIELLLVYQLFQDRCKVLLSVKVENIDQLGNYTSIGRGETCCPTQVSIA
jgi:hypothetical protein